MLRRLRAIQRITGTDLLRSHHAPGRKPRKWWVNPELARAALERDPDARDATLEDVCVRVEKLEQKHEALKRVLKSLKKHAFRANPA